MEFAFLFASIVFAVTGQLVLKTTIVKLDGVDFTQGSPLSNIFLLVTSPLFILAMIIYASSMIFYLIAISSIDISMAYPMVAVNYAIILVCSKMFFNEKVTPLRWMGVVIIILGVILVSRS